MSDITISTYGSHKLMDRSPLAEQQQSRQGIVIITLQLRQLNDTWLASSCVHCTIEPGTLLQLK